MDNIRQWSRALLFFHLFVCLVWLSLFHMEAQNWMLHVFVLSLIGIQFSWGFTVGLIVGPNRPRRPLLWFSLLTLFMPIWIVGGILRAILMSGQPILFLAYLGVFTAILTSETYCGVLLGAKTHSDYRDR